MVDTRSGCPQRLTPLLTLQMPNTTNANPMQAGTASIAKI